MGTSRRHFKPILLHKTTLPREPAATAQACVADAPQHIKAQGMGTVNNMVPPAIWSAAGSYLGTSDGDGRLGGGTAPLHMRSAIARPLPRENTRAACALASTGRKGQADMATFVAYACATCVGKKLATALPHPTGIACLPFLATACTGRQL